jgi:hypothetical protein
MLVNIREGLDRCNLVRCLHNKERILSENALTASFNVRYVAISRTISQQSPVLVTKSND